MNDSPVATPASRRDFIKTSGLVVGATALSGVVLPHVHAAGSDQISVALVGCGGRGGGAAANAMSQSGPPKLVAMADVFQNKLDGAFNSLKSKLRWFAVMRPANCGNTSTRICLRIGRDSSGLLQIAVKLKHCD